jgi:hypothetical protein
MEMMSALDTSSLGKELLLPTEEEGGWAPELIWTWCPHKGTQDFNMCTLSEHSANAYHITYPIFIYMGNSFLSYFSMCILTTFKSKHRFLSS